MSSAPPDAPEAAPSPAQAANPLRSLEDLQRALADACYLGFRDNDGGPGKVARPKRTGFAVATRLCAPGAWSKRHERYFKAAYLAGYDHAAAVGRGAHRKAPRGAQ